jgi:hypothetical protein
MRSRLRSGSVVAKCFTSLLTALKQHCGYLFLILRLTVVTLSRLKFNSSNRCLRASKFLRVCFSNWMASRQNVALIDFDAILLRHWVKVCADTISCVG